MAESLSPDICVIGAGAAGASIAISAATAGASVVLAERAKTGGHHLYSGAVPFHALIAAARRSREVEQAEAFGIRAGRPKADFMRVHDHIQEVIAALQPDVAPERLRGLGITLLTGEAGFRDSKSLAVGDTPVKARRVVIATGSVPALPAIPGLDDVDILTSDTIFDMRVCPRHLVVYGAGAHGLALAQVFRRLGAEVTVLDAEPALLGEDEDAAAIVLAALARDGIRVVAGTPVREMRRSRGKTSVTLDIGETLDASHVLIAGGRAPAIAGLNLERARIRHDARGILVNGDLRTSNTRVYAAGDVTREGGTAAMAFRHADRVVRNIVAQEKTRVGEEALPRVILTDPEIAQAGLTEAEARQRQAIRVLRWPYAELARARAERSPQGHLKVVARADGRILGATIVGRHAGEAIAAWAIAIRQGMTLDAVAGTMMPSPSYGEAGWRAAAAASPLRLTPPLMRRIINRVRRRG